MRERGLWARSQLCPSRSPVGGRSYPAGPHGAPSPHCRRPAGAGRWPGLGLNAREGKGQWSPRGESKVKGLRDSVPDPRGDSWEMSHGCSAHAESRLWSGEGKRPSGANTRSAVSTSSACSGAVGQGGAWTVPYVTVWNPVSLWISTCPGRRLQSLCLGVCRSPVHMHMPNGNNMSRRNQASFLFNN